MSLMKRNTRAPRIANATSVPIPYDRIPITVSIAPSRLRPGAMIPLGAFPQDSRGLRKLPSRAQAFYQVEDHGGVAARRDPVGSVADDSLLVDHEGGAHQALAAHPFGLLLLDDAVLAAHLALGIRK